MYQLIVVLYLLIVVCGWRFFLTDCFSFLSMSIQVLPNMASVADIEAISYDVCGVVRMVHSTHKAKVLDTIYSLFRMILSWMIIGL